MQGGENKAQEENEEIRKPLQTQSQENEEDAGGEAGEVRHRAGGAEGGEEEEDHRVCIQQ